MGWDYTKGATKGQVVKELTKHHTRYPVKLWSNAKQGFEDAGYDAEMKTVAHKVVGNTLWLVREMTLFKKENETRRYIVCCLLKEQKNFGWGYKDMSEEMHPYQYDCPPDFLDLAPVLCEEWRAKVREWHRMNTRELKVGQKYATINCKIPHVRLTSIKPLRGQYGDTVYRLKMELIGDEMK